MSQCLTGSWTFSKMLEHETCDAMLVILENQPNANSQMVDDGHTAAQIQDSGANQKSIVRSLPSQFPI